MFLATPTKSFGPNFRNFPKSIFTYILATPPNFYEIFQKYFYVFSHAHNFLEQNFWNSFLATPTQIFWTKFSKFPKKYFYIFFGHAPKIFTKFRNFPKYFYNFLATPTKFLAQIFEISQSIFTYFWPRPQKMFRPKFSKFPQNVLQVYDHGPNKNVEKIFDISQETFLHNFFRATTKRWTFCLPSLRGWR